MAPEHALQILDKVAAETATTRIEHVRLQTAITVLAAAIQRAVALEAELAKLKAAQQDPA